MIGVVLLLLGIAWVLPQGLDVVPQSALLSQSVDMPYALHVFGNSAISLEKIRVKVVYFIPQDPDYDKDFGEDMPNLSAYERVWREPDFDEITRHLQQTVFSQIETFHAREFDSRSSLVFDIHPTPVHGLRDGDFYGGQFLLIENPMPLQALELELNERLFSGSGDLFDARFAQVEEDEYTVTLIVYVASLPVVRIAGEEQLVSGIVGEFGPPALIFSPVVDPLFKYSAFSNSASIIYHELLHAMGVPEQYDLLASDALRQRDTRGDVFGRGTEQPLLNTYVGQDIKQQMGFPAR